MSKIFQETKGKIKNLEAIPFNQETWEWYVEEGLNKRLNELEPAERFIIKQLAHSRRAKGILRNNNI